MLNLRSTILCFAIFSFGITQGAIASTCDAVNADEVIKLEDAR